MNARFLPRDDNCPNGGIFYSCFRGFTGCCLIDACTPGVGCPKDKDLTPNKPSDKIQQSSIPPAQTRTLSILPSSLSTRVVTSITAPTNTSESSRSDLSSQLPSNTLPQTTATTSPSGTPETSADSRRSEVHSNNTSVIIGAVLGSIILVAIIVLAVFCIRKKKRTKIYGARYPSPEVGSDMSPHLSSYKKADVAPYMVSADLGQNGTQQLDSKAVVPTAEMGEASPRHLNRFELPAELFAPCLAPPHETTSTWDR